MEFLDMEISDIIDDGVEISSEEEEKLLELCGVVKKCKKRKAKKEKHTKKILKLAPNYGDIMVIVLDYDINPKYAAEVFPLVVQNVRRLCIQHLKRRAGNDVAIFGCSRRGVDLVFSARQHYVKCVEEGERADMQKALKKATKMKLERAFKRDKLEKLFKGKLENVHDRTQIYQTFGMSLAYIMSRRRKISGQVDAKIVMMSGSYLPRDVAVTNIKNMLTAAKSMRVAIDVLNLEAPMQPVLHWATKMTGGTYFMVRRVKDLKKKIKAFF